MLPPLVLSQQLNYPTRYVYDSLWTEIQMEPHLVVDPIPVALHTLGTFFAPFFDVRRPELQQPITHRP